MGFLKKKSRDAMLADDERLKYERQIGELWQELNTQEIALMRIENIARRYLGASGAWDDVHAIIAEVL
jgi:hypothetical protein